VISLLLPTRGRPDNLRRFYRSIEETSDNLKDIEVIVRVDKDDPKLDEYNSIEKELPIKFIYGDRDVLSKYWNECWRQAKGPIYGHMGDDIIFRTKGWDSAVKDKFNEYEDKIVFVHGDDGGGNGRAFGTHGFIHKEWADTVGYFVPPYFSSDYNDTWLNDVSNILDRRAYVDILTEHMHFVFGKGPKDQTHIERLERHNRDNVDNLYNQKRPERESDANKLRENMK